MVKIYKEKFNVKLCNAHEGAVMNSLAAASLAYLLKVPTTKIIEAIQQPITVSGRFEEKIIAG